ncbi:MAG: hypothetical protein A2314_08430 [Elusimicrobia bacterium RIFOXYB2_FULL_50_12]|nr:MAG: hypothetical protein A2314_08430 [Elusimicrobia bacterium RIFOXYB2_FULL_50_12]
MDDLEYSTLEERNNSEGDNNKETKLWMIIYTDMVTNLMIFFLMLYCLTWLDDKDRLIAASSFAETFGGRKNEILETEKGLEKKRQQEMDEQANIERNAKQLFSNVQVNEERIKIVLPSPVLFDSGKSNLKPEAISALREISGLIRDTQNRVVVEGHTDSIPVSGGTFDSNWELSSARSFSVIQYLIDKERIDPRRLSALGYGEFRPVLDNSTPEGRAGNRRIEINIIKLK